VQKDARTVAPLIVDIIDSHSVFQGQWVKRKAYYKKCAYKIQENGAVSETKNPDTNTIVKGKCLMID
jgi:hypothetical protein